MKSPATFFHPPFPRDPCITQFGTADYTIAELSSSFLNLVAAASRAALFSLVESWPGFAISYSKALMKL